jgi:hypothetical protein
MPACNCITFCMVGDSMPFAEYANIRILPIDASCLVSILKCRVSTNGAPSFDVSRTCVRTYDRGTVRTNFREGIGGRAVVELGFVSAGGFAAGIRSRLKRNIAESYSELCGFGTVLVSNLGVERFYALAERFEGETLLAPVRVVVGKVSGRLQLRAA